MNRQSLAGVAVLFSAVLRPSFLGAAEAQPPQSAVRVSGKVNATGDAASVTTPKGEVYNLQMDERGRSLAAVMRGESVEISGVLSEKNGARWLKVLGYTDERVTAGHEYWRRMRCIACVVLPATRNAAVPADLHGAVPVTGRHFSFKRKLTAWTRDTRFLWVAEDNAILQIGLAERKVLRSFGKKDGLPDALVYQLLSDGKTLWVVHRGGVAALEIGGGRVADIPQARARFARACGGSGGAWVIADTGTFRLKSPGEAPVAHPAIPTAERVRKVVGDGIWEAHWARRTAHLLAAPTCIGERLYVASYGDLYELAGDTWEKIADGGWEPSARKGKLWFVDSKGLKEYDPGTRKTTAWDPPEPVQGRCARLVVTDAAAWLVTEPSAAAGGRPSDGHPSDGLPPVGGGLARFGLADRTWKAWPRINGVPAQSVACLAAQDDAVWAVTMNGQFRSKSAHPGMTTTSRQEFVASGFALHCYTEKAGKWDSFPLTLAEMESRLICGQDGKSSMDAIAPQFIEDLSVGATRVFGVTRLVPKQFFGGYWPCIEQIASRSGPNRPWSAAFEHRPEEVELQGEQPLVLNISSGELTRIGSTLKDQLWEAVGHDLVLGLFPRDGTHWAVTEGGVAFFDERAGKWQRLVEPEFRWYWRATAALDDGRSLYIGSDRGLVCRLDLDAGRFESLTALKDRAISRIAKGKDGQVMVAGRQAPLGVLPVGLAAKLEPMDCDAARFDGRAWTVAKPEDLPPAEAGPQWSFRQLERKDHLDKSQGNFLCGPGPGDPLASLRAGPQPKPRYYVKEVFYPQFLCTSPDGERMWLSTYTGLLRLDLGRPAEK